MRAGDPFGGHRVQDRRRVEGAVQNNGRTQYGERELRDAAADVEQRHHDQHDVVASGAAFMRNASRRPDDGRVAQHHALRPAGGPAGVDQISRVAGGDRNIGWRVWKPGRRGFVFIGAVVQTANAQRMAKGRDSLQHPAGDFLELLMENKRRWLAIATNSDQLVHRQPVVHIDDDQTGALAGGEDFQIFEAIRRQNRDAFLVPDAARQQRVCQPEGARGELCVSDATVLEHNGGAAWIKPGVSDDDVAKIHEVAPLPVTTSAPYFRLQPLSASGRNACSPGTVDISL